MKVITIRTQKDFHFGWLMALLGQPKPNEGTALEAHSGWEAMRGASDLRGVLANARETFTVEISES